MNKRMYKLELICVKFTPIIIAASLLIDAILAYFNIDYDIVEYVIGTSFLTLIPYVHIQYCI